jgi:hypothetical protein
LALEALEIEDSACRYLKEQTPSQIVEAINAIKQARSAPVQERNFCERCGKRLGSDIHTCTPPAAQPATVQEPVADAMARYFRVCSSGGMPKELQESVQNLVYDAERLGYFKAATPPAAQRPWVGLTDEEIQTAWDSVMDGAVFTRREVYKAIEAKLKEKNT